MFEVRVLKGVRAGQVRRFVSRGAARNWADALDQEYGAICASYGPVREPLSEVITFTSLLHG
jgi:hypothetical protein